MTLDLAAIFSGTAVAAIGALTRGAYVLVRHIREQNGRIGKIEQWQVLHEKLDDERCKTTNTALAGVRERLDRLIDRTPLPPP